MEIVIMYIYKFIHNASYQLIVAILLVLISVMTSAKASENTSESTTSYLNFEMTLFLGKYLRGHQGKYGEVINVGGFFTKLPPEMNSTTLETSSNTSDTTSSTYSQ